MISSIIVFALTTYGVSRVKVPPAYRNIARVNFVMFVILAIGFSALTEDASGGVDSLKFYQRGPIALDAGFESLFQADLMYFLSGAIQFSAPISYTAFNLVGAIVFSYLGLVIIMRMAPVPDRKTILLWWFFTILPGVHFWNASFGKESLQLLAIASFFGLKKLPLRLFALLVLLMVRPHIALVLVAAELARIMLSRKSKGDFLVLLVAVVVAFYGLSYLVTRLGGTELSFEVMLRLFAEFGEEWRSSSLRLNDTSSILAYPDFFLRPYPAEIASWAHWATFIETLVVLVFLGWTLFASRITTRQFSPWLFLVLLILLLPLINPNVGTAARKKQLLPVAGLILVAAGSRQRRRKDEPRVLFQQTATTPS